MIGDVVHNLASALDNIVWELAQANPNPPSAPTNSVGRRLHQQRWLTLGFPYCDDVKKWPHLVDRSLFYVDPSLTAVFKQMQPFYTADERGEDPKRQPLWILHELWNRDKHRTVNVAAAAAGYASGSASLPDLFQDVPELPVETIEVFPLRPLEARTQLAHVRVHLPSEMEIPAQLNMQMNAQFTLAIVFGQGAPAEGANALDMLWRARNDVAGVLNIFV